MARYPLAAALAALTLAVAAPAAAKDRSAVSPVACAVPAAADAPVLPLSPDSSLADKVDQLTGVIADLQDRIAYLEDALDAPADEGGGSDADHNLDLVHYRGVHQAGHSARLGKVAAKGARPRDARREVPAGSAT